MSYNINPCKACLQKYKDGDCNINELNDCIVDTATAFSTFPSNNSLRGTPMGQNWQDCIAQKMAALPYVAGKARSFCNFQLNVAPRWLQVPHHFPQLLEDTQDPDKALKICRKMCENDRLTETCKETCNRDYTAVVNFSPKKDKKKVMLADTCGMKGLNSAGIPSFKPGGCLQVPAKMASVEEYDAKLLDEEKSHPVNFRIYFVLAAILITLILVGVGIVLFKK